MEFEVVEHVPARQGQLVYRTSEHSLDLIPSQGGGYTLLVAYLNITFDVFTRCAMQVWGLLPHTNWIQQNLQVPQMKEGSIRFLDETIQDVSVDVKRIKGLSLHRLMKLADHDPLPTSTPT